ncbi:Uncharacterized protein TCM_029100 [Theobroma cacao]|uniref:Uncharacterized protein n=1 Tax=Theobroma cacao TaxID=3641 RepID=A0A061GBH1_THECC|nr:Uncharacterized protein TCM_029100 [Theobroma cacao]
MNPNLSSYGSSRSGWTKYLNFSGLTQLTELAHASPVSPNSTARDTFVFTCLFCYETSIIMKRIFNQLGRIEPFYTLQNSLSNQKISKCFTRE